MAEQVTIFQHWIFSKFILPFVLIVTLVYAVLEKTKLLGDNRHQLNAIIAFVIGLTFTGIAYFTDVVNNMILFLSVALVILFVILLLWGFIFGDMGTLFKEVKWVRNLLLGVAGIAIVIGVLWASGVSGKLIDTLFGQSWSNAFWTNFLFVAVIVIALVLLLRKQGDSGGK